MTYSVFRSSILVFHPFANVPVTKTSFGPNGTPSASTPCPSSFVHLIKVGTPSAPAPTLTAAALRLAAIVADGTERSGIGIAATGELRMLGGRRTAGDWREGEAPGYGVWRGDGMTPVPEGMESAERGRRLEGTRGAKMVFKGASLGGYGVEVWGGRRSFSVECGGKGEGARTEAAWDRLVGSCGDIFAIRSPRMGPSVGPFSATGETITGIWSEERRTSDVSRGEAVNPG